MAYETWKDVLEHGVTITEDRIILNEDLGRTGWTQIKDLCDRVNGTWKKSESAFIFPFDPRPVIDMIVESGKLPVRNQYAYFPTSEMIISDIAKLVPLDYYIKSAKNICEPSAGTGNMANYISRVMSDDANLVCCEIDETNCRVLERLGLNVHQGDFLEYKTDIKFDLILMNPPFKGSTFIKHIRHAQSMLTYKGILLSIMPEPWLNKLDGTTLETELRSDLLVCNEYILHEYWEEAFEKTKVTTVCGELWSADRIRDHIKTPQFLNDTIDTFMMTVFNDSELCKPYHTWAKSYMRHGSYEKLVDDIKSSLRVTISKLAAKTITAFPWLTDVYCDAIIESLQEEYDIRNSEQESEPKKVEPIKVLDDNTTLLDFLES